MPITPYHCGPGIMLKSFFTGWFSFVVFSGVQIIIDLEVIINIINNKQEIHTFFHTLVGSSVAALIACVLGMVLIKPVGKFWNHRAQADLESPLYLQTEIPLKAVLIGAFTGAYSHVFLDSIMHIDVKPFTPFSDINPAYGIMGIDALQNVCLVVGVFGLFVWGVRVAIKRYV